MTAPEQNYILERKKKSYKQLNLKIVTPPYWVYWTDILKKADKKVVFPIRYGVKINADKALTVFLLISETKSSIEYTEKKVCLL